MRLFPLSAQSERGPSGAPYSCSLSPPKLRIPSAQARSSLRSVLPPPRIAIAFAGLRYGLFLFPRKRHICPACSLNRRPVRRKLRPLPCNSSPYRNRSRWIAIRFFFLPVLSQAPFAACTAARQAQWSRSTLRIGKAAGASGLRRVGVKGEGRLCKKPLPLACLSPFSARAEKGPQRSGVLLFPPSSQTPHSLRVSAKLAALRRRCKVRSAPFPPSGENSARSATCTAALAGAMVAEHLAHR